MSDEPHRSLPTRPAWRRVAERGDNSAFAVEEICRAIGPALEQDCHADISPEFLRSIRRVFEEREASLFKDDVTPQIESLRGLAGFGIGRAVLNNVSLVSATEAGGISTLIEATKAALVNRAVRGAWQVEEHDLRKSSAPRANNVRARLEQGIADTDFEALAARILNLDPSRPPRTPLKQRGLDSSSWNSPFLRREEDHPRYARVRHRCGVAPRPSGRTAGLQGLQGDRGSGRLRIEQCASSFASGCTRQARTRSATTRR